MLAEIGEAGEAELKGYIPVGVRIVGIDGKRSSQEAIGIASYDSGRDPAGAVQLLRNNCADIDCRAVIENERADVRASSVYGESNGERWRRK